MKSKKRNELRREMRKIVANLDPRWMKAASNELCSHLCSWIDHDLDREIRRVLAWTSFFPGEVDLSPFIQQQLLKREVYLPRSLPDRTMTFLSIGSDWSDQVEQGFMGIPEPNNSSGSLFVPESLEDCLIVVPGLAFDKSGNRIGRGKGYYDRFLGTSSMDQATKVGVCWKLQLVDHVPTHEHDVRMNWLCHEEGMVDPDLEAVDSIGEVREDSPV